MKLFSNPGVHPVNTVWRQGIGSNLGLNPCFLHGPKIQSEIHFEGLGVGFCLTLKVLFYEVVCFLRIYSAHGFCDVLTRRLNRLPLPRLSLHGHIA